MSINRPVAATEAPAGVSSAGTDDADDQPPVEITVVHGSVANAEYPLMIGGFEDEQFGGAGALPRPAVRRAADVVVRDRSVPDEGRQRPVHRAEPRDKETEPPGGYVIGLGSVADVQREELTFGVRQALVDRCMRLYRDPPPPMSMSTARWSRSACRASLIGVREENGIRIEDSVAGIVEGVLQANLALARYEAAIAEPGPTVRVTALEFVERFAERANLAAVSLRRLPTAVQLSEAYVDLRTVTVESRPGGLAARRDVDRRRPAGGGSSSPRPTSPIVGRQWRRRSGRRGRSLLTRRRRARSRGARRSCAAPARPGDGRRLVDSVALDTGRRRTAATLYDQLIPHELRSDFQTTSACSSSSTRRPPTIRGSCSARRARSVARQAGGSFGGAMRQFTESREPPAQSRSGPRSAARW